jgi:transcriptional regulator of acetoin/glycerol metabolism
MSVASAQYSRPASIAIRTAARALGLTVRTLYRRIKKFGLV